MFTATKCRFEVRFAVRNGWRQREKYYAQTNQPNTNKKKTNRTLRSVGDRSSLRSHAHMAAYGSLVSHPDLNVPEIFAAN